MKPIRMNDIKGETLDKMIDRWIPTLMADISADELKEWDREKEEFEKLTTEQQKAFIEQDCKRKPFLH